MSDLDLDQDVRLIRRNLAKGFISQDAVRNMLSELPDVSDRATWTDPEAELERERAEDGDQD